MTLQQRSLTDGRVAEIVHGYTMGDGHLKPSGALTVDHGPTQLEFVEWMGNELKDVRTPDSKIATVTRTRKDKKSQKETVTSSYRFNTRAVFKLYHKVWYQPTGKTGPGEPRYIKVLPKEIKNYFTPLFISVWYAADGTKIIGSKGAKFEITSLQPGDRETIQDLFQTKYGIQTEIIKSGFTSKGNQQYALAINADAYDDFHKLVVQDPLIPTLFAYKLHP